MKVKFISKLGKIFGKLNINKKKSETDFSISLSNFLESDYYKNFSKTDLMSGLPISDNS